MQEHTKRRTKVKKRRSEKFVDFAKLARNKLAQNEHEREKRRGIIDKETSFIDQFYFLTKSPFGCIRHRKRRLTLLESEVTIGAFCKIRLSALLVCGHQTIKHAPWLQAKDLPWMSDGWPTSSFSVSHFSTFSQFHLCHPFIFSPFHLFTLLLFLLP